MSIQPAPFLYFFTTALVGVVLFSGCANDDPELEQSNALRDLAAAHAWLVPDSLDAADFYRLHRRSWTANSGVEMFFFTPPDSVDDGHRIVLLQNEISGEPVGLVFPSNASTDYWRFEFDSARGPLRDRTFFEAQFITVAEKLGKADHADDFRLLVFDLFRGSLLLGMVRSSDSLTQMELTTTSGLAEDDEDASWVRHESTWSALADTAYGVGIPPVPLAFIDRDADRIFMFDPKDMYGMHAPSGRVRVFRTGRNVIPLEL